MFCFCFPIEGCKAPIDDGVPVIDSNRQLIRVTCVFDEFWLLLHGDAMAVALVVGLGVMFAFGFIVFILVGIFFSSRTERERKRISKRMYYDYWC